jgi:hypothetical protein
MLVACAVAPTAKILSLILFGIAFGYVEASVVVYLRMLAEPIRQAAGLPLNDLFPLTRPEQLGPYLKIVRIEVVREAATLFMLVAVALAVARNFRTWLAAFSVAFGVWDLVFYASLKALIGWPASIFTWDLLFLLPVPWTGPVLAPSIVAATLTIGGIAGLIRTPERVPRISWALLVLGGAILLASFMWDWQSIVNGGVPGRFPWTVFAIGEAIGVAGLIHAIRRKADRHPVLLKKSATA